jgi:TM2 domain-containing membrane protein YozV
MPIAGLLAWVFPGLGHFYLGHRARGLVYLVTITATFWTGVAIGGVRGTVNPKERKLWFVAQFCTAGNTAAGYAIHRQMAASDSSSGAPAVIAHWSSVDVGIHYTGVAGLLNLLVIFDAIARAEPPSATRRRGRAMSRGVP